MNLASYHSRGWKSTEDIDVTSGGDGSGGAYMPGVSAVDMEVVLTL